VYDAAEELASRGLVTIEPSTPRRFRSVSIERAFEVLSTEYNARVYRAITELESVGNGASSLERDDIWTSTDESFIRAKMHALVDDAETSVFYATDGSCAPDPVLDALDRAADRGVSVHVAGLSSASLGTLSSAISNLEREQRPWDAKQVPVTRLLSVDEGRSIVTFDTGEQWTVWGGEGTGGFASLLRTLFGTPVDW